MSAVRELKFKALLKNRVVTKAYTLSEIMGKGREHFARFELKLLKAEIGWSKFRYADIFNWVHPDNDLEIINEPKEYTNLFSKEKEKREIKIKILEE